MVYLIIYVCGSVESNVKVFAELLQCVWRGSWAIPHVRRVNRTGIRDNIFLPICSVGTWDWWATSHLPTTTRPPVPSSLPLLCLEFHTIPTTLRRDISATPNICRCVSFLCHWPVKSEMDQATWVCQAMLCASKHGAHGMEWSYPIMAVPHGY